MVSEDTLKSPRDARPHSVANTIKSSQSAEASASDTSAAATATKSASTDAKLNSDQDGFFHNEAGVKLEIKVLPISHDVKEWAKHARKTEDGSDQLCCTWETRKNGDNAICGYSSKPHLVKRHVENTHM